MATDNTVYGKATITESPYLGAARLSIEDSLLKKDHITFLQRFIWVEIPKYDGLVKSPSQTKDG